MVGGAATGAGTGPAGRSAFHAPPEGFGGLLGDLQEFGRCQESGRLGQGPDLSPPHLSVRRRRFPRRTGPSERPLWTQPSQSTRMDRGTVRPNQSRSRSMKPRRSRVRIIWLTEGAETRKCRWMSVSAGATPNRRWNLPMNSKYSLCRGVGSDTVPERLPRGFGFLKTAANASPCGAMTSAAPLVKRSSIEFGSGWPIPATTSPASRSESPARSCRTSISFTPHPPTFRRPDGRPWCLSRLDRLGLFFPPGDRIISCWDGEKGPRGDRCPFLVA
jgi:hypothetical protein